MDQLRAKSYEVSDAPGQEDFGWYFTFQVSDIEHSFVIGHRPGGDNEEGLWIAWLERSRGFLPSLVGARKRGIQPIAQVIQEILSGSSQIRDIHWHFARDFDAGSAEMRGS